MVLSIQLKIEKVASQKPKPFFYRSQPLAAGLLGRSFGLSNSVQIHGCLLQLKMASKLKLFVAAHSQGLCEARQSSGWMAAGMKTLLWTPMKRVRSAQTSSRSLIWWIVAIGFGPQNLEDVQFLEDLCKTMVNWYIYLFLTRYLICLRKIGHALVRFSSPSTEFSQAGELFLGALLGFAFCFL